MALGVLQRLFDLHFSLFLMLGFRKGALSDGVVRSEIYICCWRSLNSLLCWFKISTRNWIQTNPRPWWRGRKLMVELFPLGHRQLCFNAHWHWRYTYHRDPRHHNVVVTLFCLRISVMVARDFYRDTGTWDDEWGQDGTQVIRTRLIKWRILFQTKCTIQDSDTLFCFNYVLSTIKCRATEYREPCLFLWNGMK